MERDESLVSNMTHPLNSQTGNESAVDDESSIATIVQDKKNAAVVSTSRSVEKNATAAPGNTSTTVASTSTKGNEGGNGNTTASK